MNSKPDKMTPMIEAEDMVWIRGGLRKRESYDLERIQSELSKEQILEHVRKIIGRLRGVIAPSREPGEEG